MHPGPIESSQIVPFAPSRAEKVANNDDSSDNAGRSIMGLLQQAATSAKENYGHAVRVAQGLSLQLRAAEDRVNELEAELHQVQQRAVRAEDWLQRISREIENRFFEPSDGHQQHGPARQKGPYSGKA
jgi:hypothetical protein